jgi:arylsulfatase A-like enzyme
MLLFLACWGGAPDRSALLSGYDVLLIAVDALRADHLGSYDYTRDTSPFVDSLAEQGIVFESAVANSSYTRESVAALLTGSLPSRSGAVGWLAQPGRAGPHLGEIFRRAGYRTGFYSNTSQLALEGFARGFDEVQFPTRSWKISREGGRLSALALDFVRRAGDRPVFLYLHYLDPHAPYDPAPRLRQRFAPSPLGSPLDLYDDVQPRFGELVAGGFGPGEAGFEDLVARYDAEIASTDEALESLFRGLESLGRRERTLVVITGDHGEEFLEHGFVEHAWTLYEESIQVPLIFWAAGALEPVRVARRVSLVDVLPTVLDLVGIEEPDGELDGASLLEQETGRPLELETSRPHFAELLIEERNVVRAVVQDEWKYLAVHRWTPPEGRGGRKAEKPEPVELDRAPIREELYDLSRDPLERQNRSAESKERLESLRAVLRAYLDSADLDYAERRSAGKQSAAEIPPETLEQLRALGYRQAD